MAQGGQAYQALPRRDSDANLPAESGLGDASAENAVVQNSELGQASTASQKPPGSSPLATAGSDAATAFAAAAVPPVSEVGSPKAWRVLDWFVAYFLCTSLVHFVIQRNIPADSCACIALLAAVAHVWWRLQQRSKPAEAFKAAINGIGVVVALAMLVGVIALIILLFVPCDDAKKQGGCLRNSISWASLVYYLLCPFFFHRLCNLSDVYLPPPRPKTYEEERKEESRRRTQVIRKRAKAYVPLSAQALRAQQIREAVQQLATREKRVLERFESAMSSGSVVEQYKAHREWSEVAKKLEQLKADPERHLPRLGAPSEPIVTV